MKTESIDMKGDREDKAHRDFPFHYKREERLARRGAPDLSDRGQKRGFLKGNRSLIYLLIDLIFISLFIVIFLQFFYSPSYEAELAGCSLSLRGIPFRGGVVASLRVEDKRGKATGERVFVRFVVGEEELRLSEEIFKNEQGYLELTGTLPGSATDTELLAEVQIGKEEKTLLRKLEK